MDTYEYIIWIHMGAQEPGPGPKLAAGPGPGQWARAQALAHGPGPGPWLLGPPPVLGLGLALGTSRNTQENMQKASKEACQILSSPDQSLAPPSNP